MGKNYELNIEKRAKWFECYISINEVVYRIYYKTTLDGMFHLYVDEKCVLSKKNWLVKLNGLDYAVEIDGERLHCVFAEKKLDVAVWGKYIKGQKNYIPLKVLSRHYTTMFVVSVIMIIVTILYAAEVIKLTNKEFLRIGILYFGLGLVLAGYQDFYDKKAKKEQKLREDAGVS